MVVPGLLLLELFAVVLFTTGSGTAVAILFTSDADLFLAVARLVLLLAGRRRKVGTGRVGRVLATFPPGLVVGELELQLLVGFGGGAALVLLVVTVGRRKDAEGNGDSCFKIQVDCLGCARRVVLLSTFRDRKNSLEKLERKSSLASSWGKEVERREEKEKDPTNWNGLLLCTLGGLFWFRSGSTGEGRRRQVNQGDGDTNSLGLRKPERQEE